MRLGRIAVAVALMGLIVGALVPGVAGAAKAKEVAYEALADASGVHIILQQNLDEPPNVERGGAASSARVTSKPKAEGLGQGVIGEGKSTTEATAPPDDDPAAKEGDPQQAGNEPVLSLHLDPATSDAAAEADDGTPSSLGTATFGPATITGGPENTLQYSIAMDKVTTTSRASGKGTDVRSRSTASETTVTVDVLTAVLAELCDDLAEVDEALGQQCSERVGSAQEGEQSSVQLLSLAVSDSFVDCTWDGETAKAGGKGASVTPTVFGQQGEEIASGEPPQTQGDGTALEFTVGAGSFGKERSAGGKHEEESISAESGAAFVRLFGGQVTIQFSANTCSTSGQIPKDEVLGLAQTGAVVIWYLLGGALLVTAALGLRRVLRATP